MSSTSFRENQRGWKVPPDVPHDEPAKRYEEQFFKTKTCMFWEKGACTRGQQCKYAHGSAEIQEKPDLSKTAFCRLQLATGACNIAKCSFAHSQEELRLTDVLYAQFCASSSQRAHPRGELRSRKFASKVRASSPGLDDESMWKRNATMPSMENSGLKLASQEEDDGFLSEDELSTPFPLTRGTTMPSTDSRGLWESRAVELQKAETQRRRSAELAMTSHGAKGVMKGVSRRSIGQMMQAVGDVKATLFSRETTTSSCGTSSLGTLPSPWAASGATAQQTAAMGLIVPMLGQVPIILETRKQETSSSHGAKPIVIDVNSLPAGSDAGSIDDTYRWLVTQVLESAQPEFYED